MKQRLSAILGLCAFVAVAAVGIAQNADANTAAPTKNDLRLRLTEPAEGATVTGTAPIQYWTSFADAGAVLAESSPSTATVAVASRLIVNARRLRRTFEGPPQRTIPLEIRVKAVTAAPLSLEARAAKSKGWAKCPPLFLSAEVRFRNQ